MKKMCAIMLVFGMMAGLAGCSSTVDEPCMYCNSKPSKVYEISGGREAYVCSDCSSKCAFCSKKATKHYESLLGVVFTCSDCYKSLNP